jgi:hypothetical protein
MRDTVCANDVSACQGLGEPKRIAQSTQRTFCFVTNTYGVPAFKLLYVLEKNLSERRLRMVFVDDHLAPAWFEKRHQNERCESCAADE